MALLLLAARGLPPPTIALTPKNPRIVAGSTLQPCNHLLRQPLAAYPPEARRRHLEGVVELQVVIDKTGEPREIQVMRGDPLLAPAAVAAVRQWRYTPCLFRSEPIDVRTTINIDFTLSQ